MNVILKLKILGFVFILLLGGALHMLSSLIPNKKNKIEPKSHSEITRPQDASAD